MSDESKALVWGETGNKKYETGIEKAALFVMDDNGAYPKGVAWDGMTKFTNKPTGAETTTLYADNGVYVNLVSAEKFEASMECYYYPEEFEECNGIASVAKGVKIGQQKRKTFGMVYETIIGNDVLNEGYGKKLHCVYGLLATPSETAYQTTNESPEANTLSYELKSTPVRVTGFKPTSHMEFDSTQMSKKAFAALEATVYGSATEEAKLPLPDALIKIIADADGTPQEPSGE